MLIRYNNSMLMDWGAVHLVIFLNGLQHFNKSLKFNYFLALRDIQAQLLVNNLRNQFIRVVGYFEARIEQEIVAGTLSKYRPHIGRIKTRA